LLADLDPDGGDLALRYRRPDGAPLDPDLGLLSLAASLRGEPTTVVFGPAPAPLQPPGGDGGPVIPHLQTAAGGLDVLLGVSTSDQAVGLGPLWAPLARALAEVPRTVFADCGRIGPASPAMPVLLQADAVLMVARAELEELAHLRERLRFLAATLPRRSATGPRLGVVLVAADKDRAAAPRTEQLLRSSGVPVPVLGTVADDPRGAAKLRGIGSGRAGRTTLVRSIRSLLPAVAALTVDVESRITPAERLAQRLGPSPGQPGKGTEDDETEPAAGTDGRNDTDPDHPNRRLNGSAVLQDRGAP
jgi:hypothetical protein